MVPGQMAVDWARLRAPCLVLWPPIACRAEAVRALRRLAHTQDGQRHMHATFQNDPHPAVKRTVVQVYKLHTTRRPPRRLMTAFEDYLSTTGAHSEVCDRWRLAWGRWSRWTAKCATERRPGRGPCGPPRSRTPGLRYPLSCLAWSQSGPVDTERLTHCVWPEGRAHLASLVRDLCSRSATPPLHVFCLSSAHCERNGSCAKRG